MKSAMKSLLLALFIACWARQAFAQCSEMVYKEPKEEERAALPVESVEGNALFSVFDGPGDSGRASDMCIALFTEDGRFAANTTTNRKGEFSFSGTALPLGRYRLIASSKAFKDLNVLIEVIQTSDTNPEKRNRILLHMKMKS